MDQSLLRRLDSPWLCLIVAAVSYIIFIGVTLAKHGYDPSYFVVAGEAFCDPDLVPDNLVVLSKFLGYDGQFYYRLALNPFTSERTDFGVTFDQAPYRHQRIVYPLVAWALSLGRSDLVPIVMILINYVALCAMARVGGLYAQSMQQHALWGLALPFYPGFLITLSLDLPEILAVLFLLASLLLLRQRRHLCASLVLTLAVLTKETAILVPVAVLLLWFARSCRGGRSSELKRSFFAIPLLSFSLWQLLLFYLWGQVPLFSRPANIGVPFSGLVNRLAYVATPGTDQAFQRLYLAELCFIFVFAILGLYSLRSTLASTLEKVSWLSYAILLPLLSRWVWFDDTAFLRALSEFYLLGTIIIVGSQLRAVRIVKGALFAWAAVLWLFLFVIRMDFWR